MSEKMSKLEGYLRVADVPPRAWAMTLSKLTEKAGLTVTPEGRQSYGGDIACLELPEGRIFHLKTPCALTMESTGSGEMLYIVMLLKGNGSLEQAGSQRLTKGKAVTVFPGRSLKLSVSAGSELIFFQVSPVTETLAEPVTEATLERLSEIIHAYLARAQYFRNHEHAMSVSGQVINHMVGQLTSERDAALEGLAPELESRVERALKLIETEEWQYSLTELAGTAGASQRNLYNLMKRQIGMTPYHAFQRYRLLKVRRGIVSDASGRATIGPLAKRMGFMHLGRFSSLYRRHFGELPSETVAECARLRGVPANEEQHVAAG